MNGTVGSRSIVELCAHVCACEHMCVYMCTHAHTHTHTTSFAESIHLHTRVESSRSHSYYQRHSGLHGSSTIPEARKEYQSHFIVTTVTIKCFLQNI